MDDRQQVVAITLRFLQSGWVDGSENRSYLNAAAETIEKFPPEDWWTCPLCQEVICDSHCPLEPVRAALQKESDDN